MKGYTLIELLVVVGLIAILAAITFIALNPSSAYGNARDTRIKSEVEQVKKALESYVVDNQGQAPTTGGGNPLPVLALEDLIDDGAVVDQTDNLLPDYIDSEQIAGFYTDYYVAALSSGQIVVGGQLTDGTIHAQGLFGGEFSAMPTTPMSQGCQVTYNVTNQWVDGFVAAVTITNLTSTDMNSWNIYWNFPGDQVVTNAWDINWSQAGTAFGGTNLGYNSLITANGGSVTFGFQSTYSVANYAPVNSIFSVNGDVCDPVLVNVTEDPGPPAPADYCTVNYTVPNQWANGFISAVTITNISPNAINSWNLAWTFPGDQNIINSWDVLINQSGSSVTAGNQVYNSTINPGSGVTFGFQATYSGANAPLPSASFTLNGFVCQ